MVSVGGGAGYRLQAGLGNLENESSVEKFRIRESWAIFWQ
jgi:hypothetical protein